MRPATWREPEVQASLETLAARGLSAAIIAHRLRMTKDQVTSRARDTGVKLHGRPGRPRK